jgi:hypothetical protein
MGRGAVKGCSITFLYWWSDSEEDVKANTPLQGLTIDSAISVISSRISEMSPETSQKAVLDLSSSLAQYTPLVPPASEKPSEQTTTASTTKAIPPAVVTRKELRSMSAAEQERFVNALEAMMQNQKDESGQEINQSSEFFRLAGYHGWPNDYCVHRQELFPGWHRAYLVDFEQSLKAADVKLGGDGNVSLPYWDWTRVINNEVMPAIIRKRFPSLPSSVLGKDMDLSSPGGKLASVMFKRIPNEDDLLSALEGSRLGDAVQRALEEDEHFKAASTRWRGGSDIESPHNSVHVACGFPMTSVYYAAFHPVSDTLLPLY